MGELDEEKERKKLVSSLVDADTSVPAGGGLAADVDESTEINRDISVTLEASGPHPNNVTDTVARRDDSESSPSVPKALL